MQIKIKYFGGLKVKKVKQTKYGLQNVKHNNQIFQRLKDKKKVKYCRIWAPKCPMQVDRIRPFCKRQTKSQNSVLSWEMKKRIDIQEVF